MGKKVLIILILVVVILVLVAVFSGGNVSEAPSSEVPTSQVPAPARTVYTDAGFSPSSFTIQAGDTVVFLNQSATNFWPASAIHPTHAVYPTTGGCIGSTFDACESLPPGSSWSFRFDESGTWKYHNHLSPSRTGTVVVE